MATLSADPISTATHTFAGSAAVQVPFFERLCARLCGGKFCMEEMTAIDPLVTWIGCVAWLLNPVNDEGWDEKTAGKQVNGEGICPSASDHLDQ